jgi:hypothetical protein
VAGSPRSAHGDATRERSTGIVFVKDWQVPGRAGVALTAATLYVAILAALLTQGGQNALLYVALLLLAPADLCLIVVTFAIRRLRAAQLAAAVEPSTDLRELAERLRD